MSAVDDAKKYLSLRPAMENKTIFALHPDVLVAGLLDEIDRLRAALQQVADFELHGDYSNAYRMPKIARAALKEDSHDPTA